MAKVTCKICGEKIEKETAYCITKVNENTGKRTNSYFCSIEEYERDKFLKSLWTENLKLIDSILGYTCLSKVKVNELKKIEEYYSREQIYNCLKNNVEEIKRYLDSKDIYDEYGKISYIFACIRNKIKDETNEPTSINTEFSFDDNFFSALKYEEDEDIFKRLEKQKDNMKKQTNNILEIIKKNKK